LYILIGGRLVKRDPKSVLVGDPCTFNKGARTDTYPDYFGKLKGVAVFKTISISKIIFRQYGNYN